VSPRTKRLASIGRVAFGLVNAGMGVYFLILEMRQAESHTAHVWAFLGWIAFGYIAAFPSLFLSTAKQLQALLPTVKIGGDK
jgi:hypothetical protein